MRKVNFENINEFLKQNYSKDDCGHSLLDFRILNFNYDNYRKKERLLERNLEFVGDLIDDSLGTLSWCELNLMPNNKEIYIGCFPYHNAEVLICNLCNQVIFRFHGDKGKVDRPANYNCNYVADPATKSVGISKDKLPLFIDKFELYALNEPHLIQKECTAKELAELNIKKYIILNYHNSKLHNEDRIYFDIISNRSFLRDINEFVKY